jgi:hypothetical protein
MATGTGDQPPGAGDVCRGDDWPGDDREPPSEEELWGLVFDPDTGPPEGWDPAADQSCLNDDPPVAEALDAGFTHRFGGNGTGFCAGGPLDQMLPGGELAWHAGTARQRGLNTLSDDELVGLGGAAKRLESWASELKLAVVSELDARRAEPGGRDGEHVTEEVATMFTLTGRAAMSMLELSRRLERLPAALPGLSSAAV